MKRQVDGTEEFREPFCPCLFPSHGNSLPAGQFIVNPDASATGHHPDGVPRDPGPSPMATAKRS